MKILTIIIVLVFCIAGMPAFAMTVPSEGAGPAEEEIPVNAGGYMSQGEAILYGVLICLLVLIII